MEVKAGVNSLDTREAVSSEGAAASSWTESSWSNYLLLLTSLLLIALGLIFGLSGTN